jgi:hypothetical protein
MSPLNELHTRQKTRSLRSSPEPAPRDQSVGSRRNNRFNRKSDGWKLRSKSKEQHIKYASFAPLASMVLKGPLKIWAQKVSQNVSSKMFELNHASRHRSSTEPGFPGAYSKLGKGIMSGLLCETSGTGWYGSLRLRRNWMQSIAASLIHPQRLPCFDTNET